jgi:hypothetical protein
MITGCQRDELDYDKFSDRFAIERSIAIPLTYGELTIQEIVDKSEDSLLVIDGDTVKIVYKEDSLFYFAVNDVLDIPQQVLTNYHIAPHVSVTLDNSDRIQLNDLVNDTIYDFELENSARIDSMNIHEANLLVEVENNFDVPISIIISSSSLFSSSGNQFKDSTSIIQPGDKISESFNVDSYTAKTFHDAENSSALIIKFSPVIHNSANANIYTTDNLKISFGFDQINEFNTVFGFFGYQTEDIDTLIDGFMPDIFDKINGDFNATNPKMILNYINTIGVSTDITAFLNLQYTEAPAEIIDLQTQNLGYSTNYLNPKYSGSILYNRDNVSTIDKLISFNQSFLRIR